LNASSFNDVAAEMQRRTAIDYMIDAANAMLLQRGRSRKAAKNYST
jgi:hypothetical protein